MRLSGKVAVITGAAGGIGKAVAHRFVSEGAKVVLSDNDFEGLRKVGEEFEHETCSCIPGDVTQKQHNEQLAREAIDKFGALHIFVANAGVEGRVSSILESSEEEFERLMSINVKGPWLGLKSVIPAMLEHNGGSIIITSSIAGVMGAPSLAPYSMSKHAVIGLMKSAAKEFGSQNIRVNTVNPGFINTRMMRSIEQGMNPEKPSDAKDAMTQRVPMQRYGEPSDVAALILFLASDESRFITGANYLLDGGSRA